MTRPDSHPGHVSTPIPCFALGELVWALQGTEVVGPFPVISVSLFATHHERRENYRVRGDSMNLLEFRGANLFGSRSAAEQARDEIRAQDKARNQRRAARAKR